MKNQRTKIHEKMTHIIEDDTETIVRTYLFLFIIIVSSFSIIGQW
jgi:cell division protein FtsL